MGYLKALTLTTFLATTTLLTPRSSDEHYLAGWDAAEMIIRNENHPPPNTKCDTCDGTGKVGDGRVFTKCLDCDGDGVIDGDELSMPVPQPRKEGDRISPAPARVKAGPLKRLLQRLR